MCIISGNQEDRSAHAISVFLVIDHQQQTEGKPNICRTAGIRQISFHSEINEKCAHRTASSLLEPVAKVGGRVGFVAIIGHCRFHQYFWDVHWMAKSLHSLQQVQAAMPDKLQEYCSPRRQLNSGNNALFPKIRSWLPSLHCPCCDQLLFSLGHWTVQMAKL